MDRVTIETTSSPSLKFERINGNLRLKGWDRPILRADSERADTLTVDQDGDGLKLKSQSSCLARIPMNSRLEIGRIDGELMIKSVEGVITAEEIYGHFFAKSIGSTSINSVSGNLSARIIEGDFNCNETLGNATVQDIEGNLSMSQIKGNLAIKGICRGIQSSVKGNASLQIEPEGQPVINIKAQGNISCRLMADASARVVITSGSEHIIVNLAGQQEIIKHKEHELVIGQGDSQITLTAHGTVDLTIPSKDYFEWRFEFDFDDEAGRMADDISQIVSDQLETQLDSLSEHLASISSNLNTIDPAAADKTRAKFDAQRIKLERKLSRVERKIEDKTRSSNTRFSRGYSGAPPANDPVTDEERQKVLEMLQNKLISVEDAENLLAALEGRRPDLPQPE